MKKLFTMTARVPPRLIFSRANECLRRQTMSSRHAAARPLFFRSFPYGYLLRT